MKPSVLVIDHPLSQASSGRGVSGSVIAVVHERNNEPPKVEVIGKITPHRQTAEAYSRLFHQEKEESLIKIGAALKTGTLNSRQLTEQDKRNLTQIRKNISAASEINGKLYGTTSLDVFSLAKRLHDAGFLPTNVFHHYRDKLFFEYSPSPEESEHAFDILNQAALASQSGLRKKSITELLPKRTELKKANEATIKQIEALLAEKYPQHKLKLDQTRVKFVDGEFQATSEKWNSAVSKWIMKKLKFVQPMVLGTKEDNGFTFYSIT